MTLQGQTLKSVTCEQCQAEYVYSLQREASGEGTSWLFLDDEGASERAERRARAAMDKALREECDAVPCPACGWYQAPMQTMLRAQYRSWMLWLGGTLLVVTFFAGLVLYVNYVSIHGPNPRATFIAWMIVGLGVPGGIGLIALRKILSAGFDPNLQDLESRKRLGAERALLRPEFERLVEESKQNTAETPPARATDNWSFLDQQ